MNIPIRKERALDPGIKKTAGVATHGGVASSTILRKWRKSAASRFLWCVPASSYCTAGGYTRRTCSAIGATYWRWWRITCPPRSPQMVRRMSRAPNHLERCVQLPLATRRSTPARTLDIVTICIPRLDQDHPRLDEPAPDVDAVYALLAFREFDTS